MSGPSGPAVKVARRPGGTSVRTAYMFRSRAGKSMVYRLFHRGWPAASGVSRWRGKWIGRIVLKPRQDFTTKGTKYNGDARRSPGFGACWPRHPASGWKTARTCAGAFSPRASVALRCALKGALTSWVEVPPGKWPVWRGSWQAAWPGNWPRRSPAANLGLGGGATRQAVTCVKPGQASKGKSWTPACPKFGEGSPVWGSSRHMHLGRPAGVMGTAPSGLARGQVDRGARERGRSACGEGSGLTGAEGHRSARKPDRGVVPPNPGNSGGGKAPDFWYVFEANEVR